MPVTPWPKSYPELVPRSRLLQRAEPSLPPLTGDFDLDLDGSERTLLVSGDALSSNGVDWALAVGEGSPVRRMLALAEVEERLPLYASRKEALSAVAEGTS